jgi:hypothetical protein
MKEIPNEIITRAVELWCRSLLTPVFDNGDNTSTGAIGYTIATMNIQNDKSKIDDIEERVEKFREILTKDLLALRDGEGHFPRWLDVDYGPCEVIAKAADKAGIPHSQFSCKSSVSMSPEKVSASFGYGGEHVNHYLLVDGRWLVTTLYGGSDMDKIFDNVLNGNTLGLEVEG